MKNIKLVCFEEFYIASVLKRIFLVQSVKFFSKIKVFCKNNIKMVFPLTLEIHNVNITRDAKLPAHRMVADGMTAV